jgi:nucleotide-binding universal stress UspA family protein
VKLTCTAPQIAFKNVLVATDLSPLSESALRWAEGIARHYGSELFVTHIISPAETALVPPEYWGASQQVIEEAATRQMEGLDTNREGVPHKMLLQHGGIWESLSSAVERFGIDLLVMGTHGREGFRRLMMGSAAEEVFRRARCPVLTVGPRATAPAMGKPGFDEIVFATHFGPESLAAAPYAISLAQEFQTGLTLLNVLKKILTCRLIPRWCCGIGWSGSAKSFLLMLNYGVNPSTLWSSANLPSRFSGWPKKERPA